MAAIQRLFISGGVVMWPLLGFSILTVALILERIYFWVQVTGRQESLVQDALDLYRQNPRSALAMLRRNRNLPMARIFLAAVILEQPTAEEFRLALETAAQAELPLLKRFNTIFDTVITLSPLLGLLGTVLGLITVLANLRLGDVGATQTGGVTAGISEALVSTAAGLVVAISTLLFANIFRGLYQRQVALIQEYGGQLELLHRQRRERGEVKDAPTS